MTKILLTGAAGYIADQILPTFRERYETVLVDVNDTNRRGEKLDDIVIQDLIDPGPRFVLRAVRGSGRGRTPRIQAKVRGQPARPLLRRERERGHGLQRLPHSLRRGRVEGRYGQLEPRRRLVRAQPDPRAEDGVAGPVPPPSLRQLLRLGKGHVRAHGIPVRLRRDGLPIRERRPGPHRSWAASSASWRW